MNADYMTTDDAGNIDDQGGLVLAPLTADDCHEPTPLFLVLAD